MVKESKYQEVTKLPAAAQKVSSFATSKGWQVGYVYVKYLRSLEGKAEVDYQIVRFQGINFVIPA
jgi:hypothetical protein